MSAIPACKEPTNEERAKRAQPVIDLLVKTYGEDESIQTCLTDFLADLLHATAGIVAVEEASWTARSHYGYEAAEPENRP